MKTIAVTNQKGGVGKSTTVANLVAYLSSNGHRVLGVDMDPQGNISDAFDVEVGDDQPTVYDLLRGNATLAEVVVSPKENFDLIPSDISLAGLEPELMGQMGKEHRLVELLKDVKGNYDFCIIDCPPSLGLLVTMSLTASDYALIPYKPGRYAAKGITKLFDTITMVRTYTNPDLKVLGILATQVKSGTNNAQLWSSVTEQLGRSYDCYIFESKIRDAVAVEDATNDGTPVVLFKKSSPVAQDYTAFCEEALKIIEEGR